MESGGPIPFGPYANASAWDKYYNNITKATNCSSASDTLACLRKVPIGKLSNVLNSSVTASVPGWGVQIDNDVRPFVIPKNYTNGFANVFNY